MANFSVHLYGAAAVSSAASLGVYGLGWVGPELTQILFFLGVTGGLLPDIDADGSAPVRGFFTLLGVVLGFLVSFALVGQLAIVDLTLVWVGAFLLVRYGVFEAFARFTVHRGIWHSWLAAGFAGLAVANLAHHVLAVPEWESWLAGAFVTLGYLTHLCLDELASVDLLGRRVKHSFGTALKPFSLASPGATAAMMVGVLALGWLAPPVHPVLEEARERGLSGQALQARALGDLRWLAALGISRD
jgi:hypothetical protein